MRRPHRCGLREERQEMEHRFGIFDTVEELNRAAAAQKAEGDGESLFALAAENGIAREDAEDYLDGAVEELATPLMAAIGKLDMEEAELGLESQLKDWKGCLAQMCSESPGMCRGVFRGDRHLADFLTAGLKAASQSRVRVPDRIAEKAGIPLGIYIGMAGRDELRRIAEGYYMREVGTA